MTTTLNKILYIEDEPDIREIVKVALESIGGFTLEVCSDGEQALQRVVSFRPDLILLDVVMPGMDGPATLTALRGKSGLQHTPAVFMTARVQPHEVDKLLAHGAIGVIEKPFDPMTLTDQVHEIWTSHTQTH